MADYIPRPDADFDTWQLNFMSTLSANLGVYGLVAADLTVATAAQTNWSTKYADLQTAQAAAQG